MQGYKKLYRQLKEINLKREQNGILIVSLYVDDLIVVNNDTRKLSQLKHELANKFQVKDFGKLSYFLGLEFKQSEDKTEFTMGIRRPETF